MLFLSSLCSCYQRVSDEIEPVLQYSMHDRYIQSLPSAFEALSHEEKQSDWGKEMWIALSFAKECDLYQAITAFKRAEILLSCSDNPRLLQIQYGILICYYMGQKYEQAIAVFQDSNLTHVSTEFAPLHDLLIVLYDCYIQTHQQFQADHILQLFHQYFPDSSMNLYLSKSLMIADFPTLHLMEESPPPKPYLNDFLQEYQIHKKSVSKAQFLNALLPGSGYLYLGQKQSALTAFLLNGLFIAASIYCFDHGNIAAGAIFTSFEAGWYFGGVYGAGLEAKCYNERLYETLGCHLMRDQRLFPILMLKYAF
jgi:tetratricopeptide (TPR) repeat protein